MANIEDLKNRIKEIPVSEIIGRYVPVVRQGNYTKCQCPFHDDKNPSMNINDDKGMFYCFVDQIGGDAIKFVQLFKNLGFKETERIVCFLKTI